ncbi:3'(2'),5'-bisphosphate nucleotidase CysQ family protein [Candidatus Trichorickettsia mobilis]|uniref:3'(2'),5'-bisphosphate nucleotidase CysQ family protein n=1 Tax=Candidatus Trichorickettsia mobilis TaxID=1346319 RepID=UPI00292FF618|nr:inositol monophosphatase family protein [Candidatus Trichorickettsia mobilis]
MYNSINALKTLITEAGQIALKVKDSGIIVNYKADNSPVTNADQEISQFIYQGLQMIAPEITVICEERFKQQLTTNIFWLVDPIDGTRSYIRREESYTVNIALIKDNIPIIGLIYQPATSKLYYTDSNHGLCIEQNQLLLKQNERLPGNDKYIAVVGAQDLDKNTSTFLQNHDISKVINISSSIKLCLIAEGSADIYPKFEQTMEWDIAAGHALIISSGGNITDLHGQQLTYGKHNFENHHFLAFSKYWLNDKSI